MYRVISKPHGPESGQLMVSDQGRILVVDPEPNLGRVLLTLLSVCGYVVRNARSGDEALQLIQSEQFDLVLLDIVLPDMSGIEVCRQIRARCDAAIVILTVIAGELEKAAALQAGAGDYLTKPFAASELRARLRANIKPCRPISVAPTDPA